MQIILIFLFSAVSLYQQKQRNLNLKKNIMKITILKIKRGLFLNLPQIFWHEGILYINPYKKGNDGIVNMLVVEELSNLPEFLDEVLSNDHLKVVVAKVSRMEDINESFQKITNHSNDDPDAVGVKMTHYDYCKSRRLDFDDDPRFFHPMKKLGYEQVLLPSCNNTKIIEFWENEYKILESQL